jgi:predicted NUDIX family NTP pyrophosphohydrolase
MATRGQSAGILAYRLRGGALEVLLVHPGGPFWKYKDAGAWSIPKGEFEVGEDALAAARREFEEETGAGIDGEFVPLTPRRQKSGKLVHAWALQADFDVAGMHSNTFTLEWPPKSGRREVFPEVDRYAWLALPAAAVKLNESQRPWLDELAAIVVR